MVSDKVLLLRKHETNSRNPDDVSVMSGAETSLPTNKHQKEN